MPDQVELNEAVKRHLFGLVRGVEPVIEEALADMSTQELKHTLKHFEKYLKLDLKFYVQKELGSRDKTIDDFDTMFNQVTSDDK